MASEPLDNRRKAARNWLMALHHRLATIERRLMA